MRQLEQWAEIQSLPADNFAVAKFSCWRPTPHPTAVITLAEGSNSDARNWVNSRTWQRFATTHNLALVGIQLVDRRPSWVEQYIQVSKGSGDALLTALDQFGLREQQILMYGYSAGGEFNYEFACWRPDRVKAFIVNKGGVYYSLLAPEATRATPALLFTGSNDAEFRQLSIKAIFQLNNQAGCKWEHIEDALGHDIGDSEHLSRQLFKQSL